LQYAQSNELNIQTEVPASPAAQSHVLAACCLEPLLPKTVLVVVELFTSQVVSPAHRDELFRGAFRTEDVMRCAFQLWTIWDYMAWKKPFGAPGTAERQRAYAIQGDAHLSIARDDCERQEDVVRSQAG